MGINDGKLVKLLKPDFEFSDERGGLFQLVHDGYKQVNVVSSKKGVFRGGHFHKINREAFFVVSGSFRLVADDRRGLREEYVFGTGDMFLLEPGIAHDFEYLEDTLLIGLYDSGVELKNGEKDIIPYDKDEK